MVEASSLLAPEYQVVSLADFHSHVLHHLRLHWIFIICCCFLTSWLVICIISMHRQKDG